MSTSPPTRVRVELDGGRARFTELGVGGYLRPRPLQIDGPIARLALVGTYATLLAGDDLQLDIEVGDGVALELVEPSGTVAYHAQGGTARWAAYLRVREDARLVWRGAPFVVTAGADVRRDTKIELAASARVLLSESLVFGRTYEQSGGPLQATMRVDRDGRPLLVEDLDLRDVSHRDRPGVLGGHRAIASAFLLGVRPSASPGPHETLLAGPGALARAITAQAHEADPVITATWDRWRPDASPNP